MAKNVQYSTTKYVFSYFFFYIYANWIKLRALISSEIINIILYSQSRIIFIILLKIILLNALVTPVPAIFRDHYICVHFPHVTYVGYARITFNTLR